MIRVVIADDQMLLRKSLSKLINIDENIEVVGTVSTGSEAVEICKKEAIDIILMDIQMPELDGISAMRIIKENHPNIKVIMLTTFDSSENIINSFLSRADGYITKDIGYDELITIIKCVNYGITAIHESVKEIMIGKFSQTYLKKDYKNVLSKEEIKLTKLIVSGETNKDIAEKLNYSESTIKAKTSKVYDKLQVADRLSLVKYAVENGLT